jgi:hypothetical protein
VTRYRKKPIEVEAFQFGGEYYRDSENLLCMPAHAPEWLKDAVRRGVVTVNPSTNLNLAQLAIHTLEGVMFAIKGDWVIQGVKGEIYPCKDDIFKATYEEVAND